MQAGGPVGSASDATGMTAGGVGRVVGGEAVRQTDLSREGRADGLRGVRVSR